MDDRENFSIEDLYLGDDLCFGTETDITSGTLDLYKNVVSPPARVENSFVVTVDRETLATPNLQSCKGRGRDGEMKNRVDFSGKGITSVTYCDNGTTYVNQNIMPNITDVKFSLSGRVTIVYFADHTWEKAVLSEDDVFSVEQGISICVAKKLLSIHTNGSGTAVYNKIINHALEVMRKNRVQEEIDKVARERAEIKAENKAKKKAERKARKEAAERERAIAIQTEAYIRAAKTLSSAGVNVAPAGQTSISSSSAEEKNDDI